MHLQLNSNTDRVTQSRQLHRLFPARGRRVPRATPLRLLSSSRSVSLRRWGIFKKVVTWKSL